MSKNNKIIVFTAIGFDFGNGFFPKIKSIFLPIINAQIQQSPARSAGGDADRSWKTAIKRYRNDFATSSFEE